MKHPVLKPMKYDVNYYHNMLRMYAKTGEDIAKRRWDFIADFEYTIVLDFGCGLSFFAAHRPEPIIVDTFDIGPYVTTGVKHEHYDMLCLWDVLEHLPDFACIDEYLRTVKYVALTVPILPEGKELTTWKHFKPGEHLHYFTNETLDALFKIYGLKRLKTGYPECPPREDIMSVVYGR